MKSFLFRIFKKTLPLFARLGLTKDTPFVSQVYNFLYKCFWPYKEIVEVQGSRMYINRKEESLVMRKTLEIYAKNRIHEKATTEIFKKVVKERDIVIDAGANIGYFTLLAARLVGPTGKVFAFEPEPKNYYYLEKNIKLNNYNHVLIFQKAVSDRNGKTKLYICDYDTGHHTINKYDGIKNYSKGRATKEKSIEIETITLDDFLKGRVNKIDVIKMDVEGAEALALAGMDRILKTNENLKMFIEFFPLLIEKMGNSPREFVRKLLEDYKFSIYVIPDDYNAMKGKMVKINSVSELINLCEGEEDHINLFLEKK